MGGRPVERLEPALEKMSEENGNGPTSPTLNSLQPAINDHNKHNPGHTSVDDQLSHRNGLEMGYQEQMTILAAIQNIEAAAGEPYHVFGKRMKYVMVALIGVAGTFSGLTSSIYFPEFGTSHQVASLTITSYQLMQGLGPLLWGTLSDKLGRRQAYICSFTVYIVANIVLSFSPNMLVIFTFRGLQALGISSVISIGSGVIQDIAPPAECGGLMSIYQALRMSSMTVAPVVGGALAQRFGFRSLFITLTIFSGLVLIGIIVLLPETLRSVTGNGSVRVKGIRYKPLWNILAACTQQSGSARPEQVVKQKIELRDFLEPIHMLGDKDTILSLSLGAVVYSMWCMMTGTTTMLLAEKFGLSELEIGSAYVANGLSTCLGSAAAGRVMDRDYRSAEARYKEVHGMSDESKISPKAIPSDFPIERARLRRVFGIIVLLSLSMSLYGVAFFDTPVTSHRWWIAVLLVLQFFIAASANMIFAINSCLITDLYPGKGAAATAINNFARCTTSAGAVPLVHYMIRAIGAMPAFCSLGGAVVILCVPVAVASQTRGMKWRRERMEKFMDGESEP
ncbi:major facilitator superfamily transporter [Diaporthe helianthi]|uniref:Major facilitator superfamily transporter n=1 Tax=Diaporthe helianthi TaxID=158607 RepID=A0A2P5HM74_DIAHE|nr:major facilitator superfamily transporter [Diaporthe helianthi]